MRLTLCGAESVPLLSHWLRRGLSMCTVSAGHSVHWGRKGTVYVHWPFCSQLCTYCNFNKYVRAFVDHEGMTFCLKSELRSMLVKSDINTITSVYFGGGTPSLAKPSSIEAVLSEIAHCVELSSSAEITLEANPTSTEIQNLRGFKAAGVNRLSLGVQSLDDEVLKLFNRDHTVSDAKRALETAHELFPGRTNIDIIFGRPLQTCTSWFKELEEVLNVCGNHVSLYQLTIEQGTPLSKSVKKGELILPESDSTADMYEGAVQVFEEAGLKRYEVSNFAKPGFESQHNLSYWTGVDYIGIGPGAHSRYADGNESFVHSVNTLEPNAWMKKVKDQGHGRQKVKQLSKYERLEEVIATCLRTTDGLTNKCTMIVCNTHSPQKNGNLLPLFDAGLLILDESGLRASSSGLSVLDSILPKCIEPISTYHQQ